MSQSASRSIDVRTLRLWRSNSIRHELRDNSAATLRANALSPSNSLRTAAAGTARMRAGERVRTLAI